MHTTFHSLPCDSNSGDTGKLNRPAFVQGAVLCLLIAGAPATAQSVTKKSVHSQSDLPRFSYWITEPPSQLIQQDTATFAILAGKVRSDLEEVFRDYEINDKATLRSLLSAKLDLQEITGDYQGGLQTVESLRNLEEKPAAKLTGGLIVRARLQAALESHSTTSSGFVQAFTKHYKEAIDSLPWNVVRDEVKESYRASRIRTKAVVIGLIQTELDPAEKESGALSGQEVWSLVSARDELQFSIPQGFLLGGQSTVDGYSRGVTSRTRKMRDMEMRGQTGRSLTSKARLARENWRREWDSNPR